MAPADTTHSISAHCQLNLKPVLHQAFEDSAVEQKADEGRQKEIAAVTTPCLSHGALTPYASDNEAAPSRLST